MDRPDTAASVRTPPPDPLSDPLSDPDPDDDARQHDSPSSTPLADRSGSQTPLEPRSHHAPATAKAQSSDLVHDELERFRSEWKKEVEARGHLTYAHPSHPPANTQPRPDSHTAHTSTSTQLHPAASPSAASEAHAPLSHMQQQDREASDNETDLASDQHSSALPQDHSLPFPEAEIYAPAALKYSKAAHKLPRRPPPPPPSQSSHDLPSPLVRQEFHSHHSSDQSIDGSVSSATIRASAAPFSSSTSSSRPLAPKRQPASETPSQPSASSSSASSRAPHIIATHDAPAHASEATQAGMRSAVEAYARAVEMERSGQLDQALESYRRAFKLNSHADRLYHRAHLLLTDPALANSSTHQNDALLSSPAIADKVRKALDFDDHRYVAIKERQAKEAEAKTRGLSYNGTEPYASLDNRTAIGAPPTSTERQDKAHESRPDELAKLFDSMSIERGGERDFSAIALAPEDEEKTMPIARLPDEILLHILRMIIAPRGRRGAKVVKIKAPPEEQAAADAAAAAPTGRSTAKPNQTTGAASKPHKPVSAGAASSTANGVYTAPDPSSTGKETGSSNAKADTRSEPQSGEHDKDKASEPNAAGVIARKQPLGIGVVLGGADWQSLEMLGRTCWKMRLLTKAPSLWREIVRETYYPPILDAAASLASLYERHHSDWRTVFINQPRVRFNGCYIAACHYARPGMSEDAWIRVIHVVEFYRSIRFLPDGTALSLLTTDAPSETVRKLEPGLKAKGFSKGRWELFEQGLEDDEDEGRPRGPKVVVEDLRDKSMQKYAFRMVFGLRSTTRGRWNKLDLLEYHSVNLTNGEVLPLPQKHSRPFHFSR
ncbi:hypothetical protein L1887_50169 [Cichorium endivia]|nr:hypothetical protein L1887_50169 [Cichorium endivia]